MSGSSKQIMIHAPRWQGDGCAYTRALVVVIAPLSKSVW